MHLSRSEEKTKELAGILLETHQNILRKRALLFALQGELGAGKTVFAKGVGEHLGIKKPIRSPGFVLVAEYPYALRGIKGKLFHVDLWRIDDVNEARALGIEGMIKPGNVILIEWAQKIPIFLEELRRRTDLEVISVKLSHESKRRRRVVVANH